MPCLKGNLQSSEGDRLETILTRKVIELQMQFFNNQQLSVEHLSVLDIVLGTGDTAVNKTDAAKVGILIVPRLK